MKINKTFFLNYLKNIILATAVVIFIMKYVLNREIISLDKIVVYLLVLTVLIFIGHLIAEKRKEIVSRNK